MTKLARGIFAALLAALIALLAPCLAFADEAPEASESASASEQDEGAEDAPAIASMTTAEYVFDTMRKTAMPIVWLNRDTLFQRWYEWESVENQDFESANEDGSLSEWQEDWYISHDWSDYGIAIANLEPGDVVVVDGRVILMLGRDLWPSGVINWDVYDVVGWDKVVFQTCFGDESVWIAYGIPIYPTEELLAAYR